MTTRILSLFATAAALVAAGCASQRAALPAIPVPADVPVALQPPAGEEPFLQLHASGVQVYECAASPDGSGAWVWQFKSPEATLTDDKDTVVGRHFAGPSWASSDGATIVGKVSASVAAPERGSIPWLLLTIKSHEGAGLFAPTTSVQRLDTEGGVAPDLACSAADAHRVERVGYVATYVFWRAKSTG